MLLPPPRVLVAWYGAIPGHGTIGDLLSVEAVIAALHIEGYEVECASWCPVRGLEARPASALNPADCDALVFVCGPIIGTHPQLRSLLDEWLQLPSVAVGVSLFSTDHENYWNPFTTVFAREGLERFSDDVAIQAPLPRPARTDAGGNRVRVGLALRGVQGEYGKAVCLSGAAEVLATGVIDAISETTPCVVVPIENHLLQSGLPVEMIEHLYASCDLVLTTRLHGAILSARHGVPFIALDQIARGAKVSKVLAHYPWPFVYRVDDVCLDELQAAAAKILNQDSVDIGPTRMAMLEGADRTLTALLNELQRMMPSTGA